MSFRLVEHSVLSGGAGLVEVLVDGDVVGAIYPGPGKSINLVSVHIEETKTDADFAGEVFEEDGSGMWPPIPLVNIRFEPSPWRIVGGKIVKERPKGGSNE